MREYQVSELVGNEILAKPVCLENGHILLEIGTVLKASYKESLTSLNIHKIFIEDPYEKYENENVYFKKEQFQEFVKELEGILSHHIYKDNRSLRKLENLSEYMVETFRKIEEVRAVDIRNRTFNLYEHTIYMTLLVLILCQEYGFKQERMRDAVLGCLLHDLGYCYLNVNYENCCQESMTPMELFELKKHTILGYTAIEREEWIPSISKNMVLFHHEKLDGSGYPLKQRSNQAECRMIQICDTFDGAVSGIECQKKNICEAFERISDKQKYEIRMTEILKQRIGRYPVGSFVKMENGRTAIVVSQTENSEAPVVLYTDEFDEKQIQMENLNQKDAQKIQDML